MNTTFVPGLESPKSEVDFDSVNRAGGRKKQKMKSSIEASCFDDVA